MASRGDIEAGKAHVLVYVKNQVAGGLKAIGTSLKTTGSQAIAVGSSVAAAGAAILAPMAAAVKHFLDVGGALDDMSARTGIARSTLGELAFAAQQSGASLEDVEKSTARMQRTIVEAAQGNKTAVESLKLLGLTAKDLQGKLPDEQLEIVTDALAQVPDPAVRTAAAMEILGKSGTKLLPLAGHLRELREEAVRLGLAPTEEAVKLSDALGDAIAAVSDVVGATMFEIGAAIAPVLLPAAEAVKEIAGQVNRWIRENAQLVRTIFLIGAGLVAAGEIITAIGAGIFVLGAAFTAIAGVVSTVAGILGTAVTTLLSPVGILIAVLGTLAFLWLRFSASGKSAISQVLAALQPFIDTIKTTFQGIFDALAGGDLALAGQIAITGLQLVLAQGLAAIAGLFEGTLGDAIGTIGTQLITGDFAAAWDTAIAGITAAWDSFVAGILETMAALVGQIKQLWDDAIAGIRGSLIALRAAAGFLPQGTARSVIEGALGALDTGVGAAGGVGSAALSVTSAGANIVSAAANARERQSAGDFNRRIAGGAGKAGAAVDDLTNKLADLSGQAADARARAGARFTAESPAAAVAEEAAKKTSVAGTFSAAAFLALAQGGKTGLERIADEQLKESRKQTAKLDEQIQKTTNLERALKVA